ncbi:hypothetical protein BC962_0966 [Gillisia mitskevichiae]|uniref:Tetratricopeptide repeat protein n=1 Tax=Gillisia mitskevichiae TaxID=270921 RepID=A0A495PZN9_9FLAO|nr:hypothetical protein [Gillisia mitskevichiae]RKS55991.1 hypothetical protein BC962_0966 [Gillisia mitskevichiae]
MNSKELTSLFENSASVKNSEIAELESILEKFPFFQPARAIYLKGLHAKDSPRYNSELKRTAAHTLDRSVLFDFITSTKFIQDKVALQIKNQEESLRNITVFEPEEVFGTKSLAINEAIKMKQIESDQVMDPFLFEKLKEQPIIEAEKENITEELPISIGKPLEFNSQESHSFSEWLSLTTATPIERNTAKQNIKPTLRSRKSQLIDNFISKSPKIKPNKPATNSNIALDRTVPPEALMTETLARVYLEQKNYKKAIQAFKILSLKNPEKSGFFADQIRAIKKLQENNTGKE